MQIIRATDYDHMSRMAANIISAQVIMKPDCVLGLATGSTPIGTYEQLIRWYEKGDLDFSRVRSINLDEYKGLSPENDQSYRYFMNEHLFRHINIKLENTNVPDGLEEDSEKACAAYNEIIRQSGGIDLQLLGLGHNGHIGFNEPSEEFIKETHCVDLAQSTIDANSRFFGSCSEAGLYDGNPDDYAGKKDRRRSEWKVQSGDCQSGVFWSLHPQGSGLHPAAS